MRKDVRTGLCTGALLICVAGVYALLSAIQQPRMALPEFDTKMLVWDHPGIEERTWRNACIVRSIVPDDAFFESGDKIVLCVGGKTYLGLTPDQLQAIGLLVESRGYRLRASLAYLQEDEKELKRIGRAYQDDVLMLVREFGTPAKAPDQLNIVTASESY